MDKIVERLVEGTSEGWEDFLHRFSRLIYKVFYSKSFGFSREEIEELFHDFIASLLHDNYRKIRLFEGRNQCSFASYLKKIAINMAIDRKKKLMKSRMTSVHTTWSGTSGGDEVELIDILPGTSGTPDQPLIDQEEAEQFLFAMYRLPVKRLIVVIMIIYHDYDREELAALLKTTRQNIDVIFNRCKEQLIKLLRTASEKMTAEELEGAWDQDIASYREQIILGYRETMLKRCVERLIPQEELVVGLVFLNALSLDPNLTRLSILLKRDAASTQDLIKKVLNKLLQRDESPDNGD